METQDERQEVVVDLSSFTRTKTETTFRGSLTISERVFLLTLVLPQRDKVVVPSFMDSEFLEGVSVDFFYEDRKIHLEAPARIYWKMQLGPICWLAQESVFANAMANDALRWDDEYAPPPTLPLIERVGLLLAPSRLLDELHLALV